jgi:hypothetical protein
MKFLRTVNGIALTAAQGSDCYRILPRLDRTPGSDCYRISTATDSLLDFQNPQKQIAGDSES